MNITDSNNYSTNGEKSIGGFDIMTTTLQADGTWSEGKNLGYPFNSTNDDIFYTTTVDGKKGYMTSIRKDGYGEKDIYEIYNNYLGVKDVAVLKGVIKTVDDKPIPEDFAINIRLVCIDCDESTRLVYPRLRDGVFMSGLEPCKTYRLDYMDVTDDNIMHQDAFTTLCAAFTPDYLESFDVAVPASCWREASEGNPTTGPSDFGIGYWGHTAFSHIGTTNNSARINLYYNDTEDWLISPLFDLSGGGYELVYSVSLTDFANSNPPELNGMGSDDEVQVLISEDGGATWVNLITYNQSNYPSHTGDVETFDLSAYTGTVMFAVWATDGTVDDDEDYE